MEALAAYGGLFTASFLAATVLPAQSELVLAGLHAYGGYAPLMLLTVATLGNTLGAVVNWLLGRSLNMLGTAKGSPRQREWLDRASTWFQHWGLWSLLLSWLPLIGDPLTLVAGTARVRLLPFLVLVGIGKLARYAVIVLAL